MTPHDATVDDRIADRRREVHETGARKRMRFMLLALTVVILVGLAGVLLRSPWLAVKRIDVSGAEHTDVNAILTRHGVVEGTPTITVRASQLEDAIAKQPWVALASVTVTWPGSIEVTVLEHIPSAWVRVDKGWMLATADGILLERGTPPEGAPKVRLVAEGSRPGQQVADPTVQGALQFMSALPANLSRRAVVRGGPLDLRATVAGHPVMLGTASDADRKALSLAALLDSELPEGAPISVVSPLRPAVVMPALNPRPPVESLESPSARPRKPQ